MVGAGKVGVHWCVPGDCIKIEAVSRAIMPVDNRLNERLAEHLVKIGKAVFHKLQPGDRVVDVAGSPPEKLPTGNELEVLEAATDPRPRGAEKALSQRGKQAI